MTRITSRPLLVVATLIGAAQFYALGVLLEQLPFIPPGSRAVVVVAAVCWHWRERGSR